MGREGRRLLIVDDDPELLRILVETMENEGYSCVGCDNGQDALMHVRKQTFDLLVLDWTMPDFTGLEICRRLRKTSDITPILMLTARDGIDERVEALDSGVDDYLTKPFNIKELKARVRSALRRVDYDQETQEETSRLQLGNLEINLLERSVKRLEKSIKLSNREFDLLHFLVKNKDQVQSRESILRNVWGDPFDGDPNTLDVYMGYLRKKLDIHGEPQLLLTVRGVGFMATQGASKS